MRSDRKWMPVSGVTTIGAGGTATPGPIRSRGPDLSVKGPGLPKAPNQAKNIISCKM